MTALMKRLILAVHSFCMNECQRSLCCGCIFEKWFERNRQINLFMERRARIATVRRINVGSTG